MKRKILRVTAAVLSVLCMGLCVYADTGSITAEYSYDDNSVRVYGICAAGKTTAALYIIPSDKNPEDLSDENIPVAAEIAATGIDGSINITILLPENLEPDSYTVYLFSEYGQHSASFAYLSDEDAENAKKNEILEDMVKSSNWQTLKTILLGTDYNGETVNDNFDLIGADTAYYSKLKDKNAVFQEMYRVRNSMEAFGDIPELFYNTSKKLYQAEVSAATKPPASSPGGSRVDTGNVSVVIKEISEPAEVKTFSDMAGHWAMEYAETLAAKNVLNGYEDKTFRPDLDVTRSEFVKMIISALNIVGKGTAEFDDVDAADWFEPYVSIAASRGIALGSGGKFRPDEKITRQDAAVILYRAINLISPLEDGYVFFADEDEIDEYSSDAIRALGGQGIMTGMGDKSFAPKSHTTRGQAAALICRAIDYISAH
jgi:hypothetical protein